MAGEGAESADGSDDEDDERARRRDHGDHDEPIRAADLQQQDRLEGEQPLRAVRYSGTIKIVERDIYTCCIFCVTRWGRADECRPVTVTRPTFFFRFPT